MKCGNIRIGSGVHDQSKSVRNFSLNSLASGRSKPLERPLITNNPSKWLKRTANLQAKSMRSMVIRKPEKEP